MADPPMYGLRDLRTWVTLVDVYDANEALDLKAAMVERAGESQK